MTDSWLELARHNLTVVQTRGATTLDEARIKDINLRQLRAFIDDENRKLHPPDAGAANTLILIAIATLTAFLITGWSPFCWAAVIALGISILTNLERPEPDPIDQRHAADRALRNEYPE